MPVIRADAVHRIDRPPSTWYGAELPGALDGHHVLASSTTHSTVGRGVVAQMRGTSSVMLPQTSQKRTSP